MHAFDRWSKLNHAPPPERILSVRMLYILRIFLKFNGGQGPARYDTEDTKYGTCLLPQNLNLGEGYLGGEAPLESQAPAVMTCLFLPDYGAQGILIYGSRDQ